jgi:hypothetical protein
MLQELGLLNLRTAIESYLVATLTQRLEGQGKSLLLVIGLLASITATALGRGEKTR